MHLWAQAYLSSLPPIDLSVKVEDSGKFHANTTIIVQSITVRMYMNPLHLHCFMQGIRIENSYFAQYQIEAWAKTFPGRDTVFMKNACRFLISYSGFVAIGN
jgi:hypothetical protein